MTKQSPRQVACPTCKSLSEWTPENRFRPFCSERCKLIDLGQWATEQYRVAAVEEDLDELTRNSLN